MPTILVLDGVTNAGPTSSVGEEIALSAGQTLTINLAAGPPAAWFEAVYYRCRFKIEDADNVITDHYADAFDSTPAAALALAQAEGPIVISGDTRPGPLLIWLPDTVTGDNSGGITVSYTVT